MWLLLACSGPPAVSSDVLGGLDPQGAPDDTRAPEDSDPGVDTEDGAPVDQTAPRLLLNEVMTDNQSTLQVEGQLVDWIELYNADSVAVSLSRVTLQDKSDHVWLGRDGEVAPGGHLLLYADERDGDEIGRAHV